MALHVMEEASRCLGCKKPRCREGCPIHTNIPEVIRLLKENRLNEARTDMLPAFLAYARPLIQAELTPIYINGLTQHSGEG